MTDAEIKTIFASPVDERAVLSLSLKDINNFYALCSKVSVDDFLCRDNYMVFLLLKGLMDRGIESFDLPMVIKDAEAQGVLQVIGGYLYLESITNMPVSSRNFDSYVYSMLESSTKYRLHMDLHENIALVGENAKGGISSSDLIGSVERSVLELSTKSKSIKEPRNLADGLREDIEKRRQNPVKVIGVSTGYSILDNQIDGLVPGTLTIISARLKRGKSTFLSNIAAHVAYREAIPVLYVDTEMTFEQWRDRIVANLSGIKERTIKHGDYGDEDYERIMKATEVIERGKLFHEFMPGYTTDKLVALYKKYKHKHNIGLIVFDYLKEPDLSSVDKNRKEHQLLGDVTTCLKDLAGTLGIPALTAVQINRSGDVADSDRIARYGDIVAQWMNKKEDEFEAKGAAGGTHKLVVRDTRRGGMTSEEGISYFFFKESLRIREVPGQDQISKYGDVVVNYGGSDSVYEGSDNEFLE